MSKNVDKIDKPSYQPIIEPIDKYDLTLIYQLDVYPLVSSPVSHSVIFKFTRLFKALYWFSF